MNKLRFIVSLTNNDNDYQIEQAAAAQETARRLNVDIELLFADNDAILQSQQILKVIQSGVRPDGIVFEPVGGTAFPQVAKAAANAGIGWVVLNRDVDYLTDLRRTYKVPLFAITSDHEQIGRMQGEQLGALLPKGGSVLLIQGPAESLAAKQRTTGMYETKPSSIQVKTIRANWTEAGAYKAVSSWLKLSTSQQTPIDVVAAQDDSMAIGARRAFDDLGNTALRDKLLTLPFLGIDGVRTTGQTYVRRGQLTATIIVPTNTDQAIQMLTTALQNKTIPQEKTLTVPRSLPTIEELAVRAKSKGAGAGAQ